MTAPLAVRIETLVVHAPSAREGRALAEALPAALAEALNAASADRLLRAPSVGMDLVDAGSVGMPTGSPGLAEAIARQVVDAVFMGRSRR